MLGVRGGRERYGARCDGPDTDIGITGDARREDGDESEHVCALMAATRTGGAATLGVALIRCSGVERAVNLLWGRMVGSRTYSPGDPSSKLG